MFWPSREANGYSNQRPAPTFRGSHRGVQLPGNPRSLAVMNLAKSLLILKAMSATRQEIRGARVTQDESRRKRSAD
jgi:hypothetical protein